MSTDRKAVVVGGTGSLGRETCVQMVAAGFETTAVSRHRPDSPVPGVAHRVADLRTGAGLEEALAGVDVVVDAANTVRSPIEVLVEGTSGLIEQCRQSEVGHYIGVSIVGCEKIGFGYYRAKTAQEQVIREAPIGWSLIKATQFHDLLASAFGGLARYRISPRGPIPLQPIAAAGVVRRLVEIAEDGPLNRTEQVAGPEISDLGTLARTWQDHSGRRCLPVRVVVPGKTGRMLRDGALTDSGAAAPGPTFAQWLKSGTSPPSA
ncbi:MAG: NAD(P)H-binding protein [Thermoleophilia bacterium]|nr:NAD(P)H-binding protein [Thermoleophilia bacterium]